MRTILIYFVVLAALPFIICPSEIEASAGLFRQSEIIEVAESRAYCVNVAPTTCMQVKREGKDEFNLFYDEIENFRFISGFRYILKVEIEKVPEPPKDTSGFKYYLKEIISRKRVSEHAENAEISLYKWRLKGMAGDDLAENKAFIVFDKLNGRFYGNGGCNSVSGTIAINTDTMSVSEILQTKRMCPDSQTLENPFLENLRKTTSFKIENGNLFLFHDGNTVLEFEPSS
ncbi:MAG: DUF4377 domain-containing protein [Pyrinomonadaceae bacterium]